MTGEPRTCVWASEYDALTAKLNKEIHDHEIDVGALADEVHALTAKLAAAEARAARLDKALRKIALLQPNCAHKSDVRYYEALRDAFKETEAIARAALSSGKTDGAK